MPNLWMQLSASKDIACFKDRCRRQDGLSLIEVLVAVVFLVVIAVIAAKFFPKATQTRILDRQRVIASHLATTKMESILKQPYGYIAVTANPSTAIWGAANTTCDCNDPNLDMTQMPVAPVGTPTVYLSDFMPVDGMMYKRFVCVTSINRVNGAPATSPSSWTPQCFPANADTGLKSVRVQVRWKQGNELEGVIDTQSVVSQS